MKKIISTLLILVIILLSLFGCKKEAAHPYSDDYLEKFDDNYYGILSNYVWSEETVYDMSEEDTFVGNEVYLTHEISGMDREQFLAVTIEDSFQRGGFAGLGVGTKHKVLFCHNDCLFIR